MKNDAFWTRIIYVISVVISLVVAFLILVLGLMALKEV